MPSRGSMALNHPPSACPLGLPHAWFLAIGLGILGCASGQVTPPGEHHDAANQDGAPDSSEDATGGDDGPCTPPPPPAGLCDPLTNRGCPSDQKCTALRNGDSLSLACGNRNNNGQPAKNENDDCQPTPETGPQTGDDCADGLACFSWPGEPARCHKLCPNTGCFRGCADGWACNRRLPGISGYWSCGASCRPLDQSGCQSDQGCYVAANGPNCAAAGGKATGDECDPSKINDCVAGSTCITGLSNGNRCAAYCSTSGGSPTCSSACIKLPVDDAVMSQPDVGYCR